MTCWCNSVFIVLPANSNWKPTLLKDRIRFDGGMRARVENEVFKQIVVNENLFVPYYKNHCLIICVVLNTDMDLCKKESYASLLFHSRPCVNKLKHPRLCNIEISLIAMYSDQDILHPTLKATRRSVHSNFVFLCWLAHQNIHGAFNPSERLAGNIATHTVLSEQSVHVKVNRRVHKKVMIQIVTLDNGVCGTSQGNTKKQQAIENTQFYAPKSTHEEQQTYL